MTINELVNELNTIVEAGYGNAKAIVGIPTLYVTEDSDISQNYHRDESEDIEFSAKEFLESIKSIKRDLTEIELHNAYYDTCSCWDFYDEDSEDEDEIDSKDEEN